MSLQKTAQRYIGGGTNLRKLLLKRILGIVDVVRAGPGGEEDTLEHLNAISLQYRTNIPPAVFEKRIISPARDGVENFDGCLDGFSHTKWMGEVEACPPFAHECPRRQAPGTDSPHSQVRGEL